MLQKRLLQRHDVPRASRPHIRGPYGTAKCNPDPPCEQSEAVDIDICLRSGVQNCDGPERRNGPGKQLRQFEMTAAFTTQVDPG